MHQAVEYEMKTAAAPEKAIANRSVPRVSSGKFLASDSDPQSSKRIDARTRMGTDKRLLYLKQRRQGVAMMTRIRREQEAEMSNNKTAVAFAKPLD